MEASVSYKNKFIKFDSYIKNNNNCKKRLALYYTNFLHKTFTMKNLLFLLSVLITNASFGQTSQEFFDSGFAKSNLGDYSGAIVEYNKAIDKNNTEADFYTYRGIAKNYLKDYTGAIKDYNKTIELDPNNLKAYNNRGNTKRNLQDYSGAIADYTKVIDNNSNDAIMQDSYNNRGLAKIYLKEYASAIADYNKAIEQDPYDARVFTNRGDAKQYQGKISDACMDWKKAQELGDDNNYEKIKNFCK